MAIESFVKIHYADDIMDKTLIWVSTSFSRSHPEGANESINVNIALYDTSIPVDEIPTFGKEKAIEFLREIVNNFDGAE